MTILQAILLGIVQGLTEFLPVSSSAHLVLTPALLGWSLAEDQAFVFNVLVQNATLLAVFVYFWGDLLAIGRAWLAGLVARRPFDESDSRLGWWILLATVPAGAAGLLIKDQVEAAFASPQATAGFLLVTALLLVLAERIGGGKREVENMTWRDALWIGFWQVLALFPGVSRSGSTIAGGMTRQLERSEAARFSFLMSVPVMLAAGLLSILDLLELDGLGEFLPAMAAGFIAAAITGYFAIRWLIGFLKKGRLYGFAIYVVLLAAAVFLVI